MQTDENPAISVEVDFYSALFLYKNLGGIQRLRINSFRLVYVYIAWALIQLSACAFFLFLKDCESKSYGKWFKSFVGSTDAPEM